MIRPKSNCSMRADGFAIATTNALGRIGKYCWIYYHTTNSVTLAATVATLDIHLQTVKTDAIQQAVNGSQRTQYLAEKAINN